MKPGIGGDESNIIQHLLHMNFCRSGVDFIIDTNEEKIQRYRIFLQSISAAEKNTIKITFYLKLKLYLW